MKLIQKYISEEFVNEAKEKSLELYDIFAK